MVWRQEPVCEALLHRFHRTPVTLLWKEGTNVAPEISVVVSVCGNARCFPALPHALERQTITDAFEVVLVDNDPTRTAGPVHTVPAPEHDWWHVAWCWNAPSAPPEKRSPFTAQEARQEWMRAHQNGAQDTAPGGHSRHA